VRTWPSAGVPSQYFRVMDDDTPLCIGPCGHFYERDECELRSLETGTLPFSQLPLGGRAIPVDGFQADEEGRKGEDELLAGVEGLGAPDPAAGEGKGWRAVKSWVPARPQASVGDVVGQAVAQQEELEMEQLGVLPAGPG